MLGLAASLEPVVEQLHITGQWNGRLSLKGVLESHDVRRGLQVGGIGT